MSTKRANDSTLQSTKQMLDELDALMQKMLAVPVSDPEEGASFPETEIVTPPKLSPTLAATLTLLESPIGGQDTPNYQSIDSEDDADPQLGTPEPLDNEVLPRVPSPVASALVDAVPEMPAEAGTSSVIHTLILLNQAFDVSTLAFGGAGVLLRTQAVRTLLGLAGIAMLFAACGWLAKDLLGWQW